VCSAGRRQESHQQIAEAQIVVAALGIGVIGTVLVVILVTVAILFFVRRR
jgi:hypothetical protein